MSYSGQAGSKPTSMNGSAATLYSQESQTVDHKDLRMLYENTYKPMADQLYGIGVAATFGGLLGFLAKHKRLAVVASMLEGLASFATLAGVAALVVGYQYIDGFKNAFGDALLYCGDNNAEMTVSKEIWKVNSGTNQGTVYSTIYVFTA